MIIGGIILHPVKKAVCEEILNLLNATDSTIRKDTVTSLRRQRYFYSRAERAQIDYFIDKNDEYLLRLVDSLCLLITDISPEVQKATLKTLTVLKRYRKVNKVLELKRAEIVNSIMELLREKEIEEEVFIAAAKLLSTYKAVESRNALEEALVKFKEKNDPDCLKAVRTVTKILKSLH